MYVDKAARKETLSLCKTWVRSVRTSPKVCLNSARPLVVNGENLEHISAMKRFRMKYKFLFKRVLSRHKP